MEWRPCIWVGIRVHHIQHLEWLSQQQDKATNTVMQVGCIPSIVLYIDTYTTSSTSKMVLYLKYANKFAIILLQLFTIIYCYLLGFCHTYSICFDYTQLWYLVNYVCPEKWVHIENMQLFSCHHPHNSIDIKRTRLTFTINWRKCPF